MSAFEFAVNETWKRWRSQARRRLRMIQRHLELRAPQWELPGHGRFHVEWSAASKETPGDFLKRIDWDWIKLAATAPIIYAQVIPLALLDIAATLYQRLCFPIYGITPVRRSDYVVLDRYRLPYLSGLEKLNCLYCEYGNGVLAYVRKIAARTEQRWCPIRHAKLPRDAHEYTEGFAPYGDEHAYRLRHPSRSSHRK
ncbi:hypothetical protein [Magnetofaba australis]|uniref:Uncharacterized protein n=1 Tax=Magnetofaba australis IT-1 TaxID=1434232 RepID=A0A1Y2K926_9PROT|nr:hypothetical protein [Magnetofaba australis]OSM07238.1 hypothetical protein MAIT1_03830 [Magnetofaba australis IT-1]